MDTNNKKEEEKIELITTTTMQPTAPNSDTAIQTESTSSQVAPQAGSGHNHDQLTGSN